MRIGIDVGGTFTDVVVEDEQGATLSLKIPTTPRYPERGVCEALRTVLPEDPKAVTWLGHATTIATNALLGQVGLELPRVALVTTHGFRDLIEIGRQNRSRVYDLFVERPRALVAREDRLTVRERIDEHGSVVEALDEASLQQAVETLRARSIGAVAVCFLHAYASDVHERRAAEAITRTMPGAFVARSSEIDPEYREYERFSTTVVSAALAPVVGAYVRSLDRDLRALKVGAPLLVMRSDGGMSEAGIAASRPASLIESGPASGVIAAAEIARRAGVAHALSFDMGGTTAKAGSVINGTPEIVTEYEAAGATHSGRAVKGSGYPVRCPFIDLSEVSAGGGTIAWLDEAGSLRVGPLSAGADPGPACYGRADRATVTDANVVLGRLNQTHLLGGTLPIEARRSRQAIAALAEPLSLTVEETAAGIIRIIDDQMAKALRIVTIERGLDPRTFTMIAFGGNGPLHGCALAGELGITRVLVPLRPGLLSAQGLLIAELSAVHAEPVLRSIGNAAHADLEATFERLEERGRRELLAQRAHESTLRFRRFYDARYPGQSFELQIEHDASLEAIGRRFHEAHRARYGYAAEEEDVELVNARSTVTASRERSCRPELFDGASRAQGELHSRDTRRVWIDGSYSETPLYAREELRAGWEATGPAIIEQYDCTTYIAPHWGACVLEDAILSLERL